MTDHLSGMLALFLMQRSMYEMQMSREMQAIQDMLNLRYQQYLDYVHNSEYLSRQCHDLKHQIAGMRAAIPDPESDQTSIETARASILQWNQYLDQLENAVRTYDTWSVSGNSILDAIMTQKKQYCVEHQIQLTCKADGKAFDFLSARDICTIFGNILDNAVEAVSTMEQADDRVIHGEICRKNDFLLIRFENRCGSNLRILPKELPATTKSEKNGHGYGLKSIRMAVEKYQGTMNLQVDQGWFVIKILIPVNSGGE